MISPVATLRERAEDAERKAERFRQMAEFAEKLGEEGIAEFVSMIEASGIPTNGNGKSHDSDEKIPRGREAVRQIVSERPGIWTLKDLRAEMERRQWFTSRKGLEVAAHRLCVDGEGKRIGRGRYLFPAEDGDVIGKEVEREIDPSDGAMIPFET
jgi:hypothetical protein